MKAGDIPEISDGIVPLRYAAFISYSHVDVAAAVKLQRRLETYRLPPQVRTAKSATRIGTIFRDRADLAAASSLTEAIKAALTGSGALIVLCSPEAKQSPWVDAEIRLFRLLHPDAPVLAVILRGEPGEGMPEALVEGGREPLAADFRRDGDGDKLGFLKVVAALKAVPLDSLIQRDAQRKLRRVTIITFIVGLALLAMAGMTAYAINARNEAQRQRAEAEGLIDYMLTDLRTRLRGVGNSEVMSAVNDRAMDYYRGQDLSDLPPDSLRRRAILLHAMGEDERARGQTAEAMERFEEARRATATLHSLVPNDPDRLFAHAQSEYWVGRVNLERREYAAARRQFVRYRRLAGQLTVVDTNRDRAETELGFSEGMLCSVELIDEATDRPASRHCRLALDQIRRVALRNPSNAEAQLALANRHAWLATALHDEGVRSEGFDELQRANIIVETLLRNDADNANYLDMLSGNMIMLADRQLESGLAGEAVVTLSSVGSMLDDLVTRDPQNARWRFLVAQIESLRREHGLSATDQN